MDTLKGKQIICHEGVCGICGVLGQKENPSRKGWAAGVFPPAGVGNIKWQRLEFIRIM